MIPAGSLLAARYELGPILGAGGMGVVYRARDVRSGEVRALKLLHEWRVDDANVIRFKREFRAAARLDHPNCLRPFELDNEGARWFYTMELMSEGCLRPEQWRDWRSLVPVALQVLCALDHIHSKRIVHRDVKPQNILFAPSIEGGGAPVVKVADFGISQFAEREDAPVGHVIGSLAYLAPEQLDGHADPRSDLFSLGIVLYEMLYGKNPLLPRDPLRRCEKQGLPSLDSVVSDLPRRLSEIVMRLSAPDPDKRYSSAASAHDDLRDWWTRQSESHVRRLPFEPVLARPSLLAAPRLVGRANELERLRGFLVEVTETEAPGLRLCLVNGLPGAGKSRLVAEAVHVALQMGVHVEAGTWRADGGHSWPLEGMLRLAVPDDEVSRTGPIGARAFDTGLSTLVGDMEEPRHADDASTRTHWAAYRRIVDSVIERAARRPLLFVLEDAQWADEASIDLLSFLIRSAAEAPAPRSFRLGLIITHRPVDPTHPFSRLECAASPASTGIQLAPLSPDGAAEMIASMLVCPINHELRDFAGRIALRAEGNPLYLSQTLHLLVTTGTLRRTNDVWNVGKAALAGAAIPKTIHEAVGDRASRLSVDSKRVLAASAVIGREFVFGLLEAACRLDEAHLLDCIDEAIRADLLSEQAARPGCYLFTHDRVRDAILERLPPDERRALHRSIADAIVQCWPHAAERAGELAYHFEAAGDEVAAYAQYLGAARHSMDNYQFMRASDSYERALTLGPRAGIVMSDEHLERCGDACLQAGRYERALECFASRLTRVAEPLVRAELLLKCADVEFRRGDSVRAAAQMEAVVQVLGVRIPQSRTAIRFQSWKGLGKLLLTVNDSKLPARSETSHRGRDRVVALTCMRITEVLYSSDHEKGHWYGLAGYDAARRLGPSGELAIVLAQHAVGVSMAGLHGKGLRLLKASQAVDQVAVPLDRAWQSLLMGVAFGFMGRALDFERQTAGALNVLEGSPEPMKLRQAWALRGEALLSLGAVDAAEKYGNKVLRMGNELSDARGRGWGLYILAQAASRRGEHARASGLFCEAVRSMADGSDPMVRLVAQARRAFDLLISGASDEALDVALEAAAGFASARFRHATAVNYAVLVAAAAVVLQRRGRLDSVVLRQVRDARLKCRVFRHVARLSAPLDCAARAARAFTFGQHGKARKLFEEARRFTEANGTLGDECDVHALALQILPEKDRREHRLRLAELRNRSTEISARYEST